MGSYNKEYEDYYKNKLKINKIEQEKKILNNYDDIVAENKKSNIIGQIIDINIVNIIGCLLIFTVLTAGKAYPKSRIVYDYTKNVVSKDFYYKDIIKDYGSKFVFSKKVIDNKEKNDIPVDKKQVISENQQINSFNNFEVVKKSIKEIIQDNIKISIGGDITYVDTKINDLNGSYVIIQRNEKNVEPIYDGVIKEIGEDKNLGAFVVIDHGEGIESKYLNLANVTKKVGDTVKLGEDIGQVSEKNEENIKGLILQIKEYEKFIDPRDVLKAS